MPPATVAVSRLDLVSVAVVSGVKVGGRGLGVVAHLLLAPVLMEPPAVGGTDPAVYLKRYNG